MKKIFALLITALIVISVAVPMASAAASVPPELADAWLVGTWGTTAKEGDMMHDPALDGQGIPNGAIVYGLFDANYMTINVPASITGYTAVNSISALAEGTYFVLYGSSGFNYVILSDSTPVAVSNPPVTSSSGNYSITFTGAGFTITATGVRTLWYDFDLASAGFGTGHVYALYFDDNATVSFSADTTLTAFDANFNATTFDAKANTTYSIDEVKDYSGSIGMTGNSFQIVKASAPGNYAGLVPDKQFSSLPGTYETLDPSATADPGGNGGNGVDTPSTPVKEPFKMPGWFWVVLGIVIFLALVVALNGKAAQIKRRLAAEQENVDKPE